MIVTLLWNKYVPCKRGTQKPFMIKKKLASSAKYYPYTPPIYPLPLPLPLLLMPSLSNSKMHSEKNECIENSSAILILRVLFCSETIQAIKRKSFSAWRCYYISSIKERVERLTGNPNPSACSIC